MTCDKCMTSQSIDRVKSLSVSLWLTILVLLPFSVYLFIMKIVHKYTFPFLPWWWWQLGMMIVQWYFFVKKSPSNKSQSK